MSKLDKFYTKTDVALNCLKFLSQKVVINNDDTFLEPSAGSGNFSNQITNPLIALDIAPESDTIIKQDFLTWVPQEDFTKYITVGNPPFGHRCELAIDFINHAAKFSEVIAFIVPVSFMKWSVQSKIDNNLKLIDYMYLDENSFTDSGADYKIRTVFQIWVKKDSSKDTNYIDKRLTSQPPIKHEDFDIWQYNATQQSVNVIEQDWEIATYRQGHHNYNQLFCRKDYDMIYEAMTRDKKKQQFFFIKPKNELAKKIILSMDFNALADRNMITPGFGKADFVSYYIELKEKEKNEDSSADLPI